MGNGQKALDEQVIKAYHFIQSFAPTDEVTPEEAHQIGMDFMKKTFDDRYAFVCSTHVDKNHIHNHFVMCSASRDMSGRKLDDNLSLLHSLRKNNDILCKEHGLSVIEKEKGKSQTYKEWLAEKENPTGSNKTKIRKIIDRTVMEANDFDHFLSLIKAQGIETDTGTSKKYGPVTKYKFPEEKHFHRGYSLGTFYGDESIKKRIERHIAFMKSQEEKKQLRKEQAALRKALLSPAERKLDKSKVKIRSIREQSFDNISKDSIGKLRWTNKQNAMRFEQISLEVKEKYGIAYSDIKGHISSLRADNNRLSTQITKSKKDLEELRSFVENCVAYKRYKIHSINEEKASDKISRLSTSPSPLSCLLSLCTIICDMWLNIPFPFIPKPFAFTSLAASIHASFTSCGAFGPIIANAFSSKSASGIYLFVFSLSLTACSALN